ncbi:hypothetical protein KFE25_000169 [Diacronema lutheri]|uniref:peptidylprolyl isomerase n=1 Tax=Diacronema lutheri TaxID=2081491 RepID=A0A8J6CAE1_DIALT|nr:hypothetical protein KFE25_000169 [Diacronema lutheri]
MIAVFGARRAPHALVLAALIVAQCSSLSWRALPSERCMRSARLGARQPARAPPAPPPVAPARAPMAPARDRPAARALAAVLFSLALAGGSPIDGAPVAPVHAASGPAVKSSDSGIGLYVNKDGNSILRLTLPRITELPGLYSAQELAETIKLRFDQVGYKRDPVWTAAAGDAGMLERALQELEPELLAKAPQSLQARALAPFREAQANVRPLLAALREQDISATLRLQGSIARGLAAVQAELFPAQTLPYELPLEYAGLPQLRGRAEVEMKLVKGKGNAKRFCAATSSMYTGRFGLSYSEVKESQEDMKGGECAVENTASEATIRLTLDGYHAPITAGNFAALVQGGFYDSMPVQQITDLSIQTGNAKKAGKPPPARTVPLEIFYKRDAKPTYSFTSDEDRRGAETMALPFQSYGALGMARQSADLGGEIDNDSATSEFFFVKYDQALIPPGRNTLDGAYSCFGYTSEGAAFLRNVEVGDVIASAKIVSGLENLKMPDK